MEHTEVVEEAVISEREPETDTILITPILNDKPAEAVSADQDVSEIADQDVPEEATEEIASNDLVAQMVEVDSAPVEAELIADPVNADLVTEPTPLPAADSIAAKLQRIRAVVSQNEAGVQSEDYTEDQHADAFVATPSQDITESLEEEMQDSDDEILQVLDQLNTSDFDDVAEGIEADDHVDTADTEESQPLDTGLFDDLEGEDDDLVLDEAEDEQDNILNDDPEDQAPARSRVFKVKRADIAAAIADNDLKRLDGNEDQSDLDSAPESSLSDEDEAELLSDLEAVEDELTWDEPADEEFPAEDTDTAEQKSAASPFLTQTVGEDEVDLSRLMAEADQKLDDPETSSSHETYSQLRAAAAVAQAEQSAGDTVSEDTGDDAYRDDLANVVRPRPTAVGNHRARRPIVEDRPAPLKLVAEQRVDDGASQARHGPVRPRRVSTLLVDTTTSQDGSSDGFAKFAAEMGATELPDLLEAAAAYLSFVEGREKFSRPQLMNKVRQIVTTQHGYPLDSLHVIRERRIVNKRCFYANRSTAIN